MGPSGILTSAVARTPSATSVTPTTPINSRDIRIPSPSTEKGRHDDTLNIHRCGIALVVPPASLLDVIAFVGAIWIESKEDLPNDPAWIGIGHITLEGGLILFLLPSIGFAYWWRRSGKDVAGRVVTALSSLYLLALTIAMLAMSGKWG